MNRIFMVRTTAYRRAFAHLTARGIRVLATRHVDEVWQEWVVSVS